ncbi:hypothetical protein PF007_g32068 [Phytophthora fragariae]|uniref:Secreted peptide n=1 Tax=Phytophthora fragariae TaxID=53985 RepID=A0A6A4B174_9STRA|nr:hypothetical protein PF007_g32068 [Phytophthora fragariae]KAE9266277.1 hypothetical protein PF001_g30547 [Phytophthora fragariae]
MVPRLLVRFPIAFILQRLTVASIVAVRAVPRSSIVHSTVLRVCGRTVLRTLLPRRLRLVHFFSLVVARLLIELRLLAVLRLDLRFGLGLDAGVLLFFLISIFFQLVCFFFFPQFFKHTSRSRFQTVSGSRPATDFLQLFFHSFYFNITSFFFRVFHLQS